MELPIQESQEKKYSTTFFKYIRTFEYKFNAAIFLCTLLVLIYCIWTLDRGFEITDEAYYLLLAQHSSSVKYYISAQQWITEEIWQLTRSLVMFRAAGMLLLVASSTLLALGAIHAFSQTKLSSSNVIDRHVAVIASSIISGLLYSTTINLSPCYNLLASSSACVAAGLVLFSSSNNIKWQRYVLLFLAGIAIGVEFICKPSAGIATFAILIIWMFIFNQLLKAKISAVAVTILGCVLFVTVLLYTKTTIKGVSSSMVNGFELFRMVQFEPITTRLERYFSNFFYYCFESAKSHCILIVAIVIYQINRREVFLGIAFTSLIYTLAASKYWHATDVQYLLIMKTIFVLSALILLISRRLWWKDSKAIYLVCMLITLPYSVALGTGNSLFTQVIISIIRRY